MPSLRTVSGLKPFTVGLRPGVDRENRRMARYAGDVKVHGDANRVVLHSESLFFFWGGGGGGAFFFHREPFARVSSARA